MSETPETHPRLPAVGAAAPDFSLPSTDGRTISLAALRGRKVVVYFYPKDDTSGCTKEAQDFTALHAAFSAADTELVGISPDGVTSKAKFAKKYGLTVPLAADESRRTVEEYGVWVQKSMYGRKYMGVERTTLLIDRQGSVVRVWPKVAVPGHAEEVLTAARAL